MSRTAPRGEIQAVSFSLHSCASLSDSARYQYEGKKGLWRRASFAEMRVACHPAQKGRTGFTYTRADGSRLSEKEVLKRIKALAIPPAWTDVWICPFADGHIQATGRDAKGRKQYRYHARFRAVRESTKYEHVVAFADAPPAFGRK
jgi:hypothetical protein